jgi:mono/diheme cytochrome c family protein
MRKLVAACVCALWLAALSAQVSKPVAGGQSPVMDPVAPRPSPVAGVAAGFAAAQASQAAVAPASQTPARELTTRYCISCHNDRSKVGGFSLEAVDAVQVARSAEAWEKVVVKLRSRSMPPPGLRRPDNGAYDTVASWLEQELDRGAAARPNPGRPAERPCCRPTRRPTGSTRTRTRCRWSRRCSIAT